MNLSNKEFRGSCVVLKYTLETQGTLLNFKKSWESLEKIERKEIDFCEFIKFNIQNLFVSSKVSKFVTAYNNNFVRKIMEEKIIYYIDPFQI